jgi:hypothetical protein
MLANHVPSFAALKKASFAALLALGLVPASISTSEAAQAAPATIRVGQSCSCSSCGSVVTVSMETYTRRVLAKEWISSWNAESLKAGSIAIRSYGAWYVYHPISGSYDICNTTCCQVYSTTEYTSTNNATAATANIYLVDTAGNIPRSEYSAENNDSTGADGCGNCYTSNKPNDGICLSDNVCCGTTKNGHGRGMCQWGTQRWAANRGMGYAWITDHYYAAYNYSRQTLGGGGGGGATITIDNNQAGFTASANWSTGTSAADKFGSDYRYRSTAAVSDQAQWTANITSAGTYTISAWWSQGSNRSQTATYTIPGGATATKNQQTAGGVWNTLGSASLGTGNQVTKLSCWTTTGFIVLADAVRYVKP